MIIVASLKVILHYDVFRRTFDWWASGFQVFGLDEVDIELDLINRNILFDEFSFFGCRSHNDLVYLKFVLRSVHVLVSAFPIVTFFDENQQKNDTETGDCDFGLGFGAQANVGER